MPLHTSGLREKARFWYVTQSFLYLILCPQPCITEPRQNTYFCLAISRCPPRTQAWRAPGIFPWPSFRPRLLLSVSLLLWPFVAGAQTHTPVVAINRWVVAWGESCFSTACWMEWVCLVPVLAITEKFPPPHPHPAPTLVLTSGHQLRFYRVRLPIYHTQLKIQLKIAARYFTKKCSLSHSFPGNIKNACKSIFKKMKVTEKYSTPKF